MNIQLPDNGGVSVAAYLPARFRDTTRGPIRRSRTYRLLTSRRLSERRLNGYSSRSTSLTVNFEADFNIDDGICQDVFLGRDESIKRANRVL